MATKTAMQELIEDLILIRDTTDNKDQYDCYTVSIDSAMYLLEKEKQQIINAYDKGGDVNDDLKPLYGTPEDYYTQTYINEIK